MPMNKYGVMKIKTKSKLRKVDFALLAKKEITVSEVVIESIEKQAKEMMGRGLEQEKETIDLGLDEEKLENKAPKLGRKRLFMESECNLADNSVAKDCKF